MEASGNDRESDSSSTQNQPAFEPRQDLMELIMGLGFSRNAAIRSLYYTGNHNADLAAAWLFENEGKNLDGPLGEDLEAEGSSDSSEEEDQEIYKMVFVVNSELKMGVGKVAAQVGHAAIGLHRLMLQEQAKFGEMLLSWETLGEVKVVLRGQSTTQLTELAAKATAHELPYYLVQDAGRTQIAPGSVTVLGIMGKITEVDKITGGLKLL